MGYPSPCTPDLVARLRALAPGARSNAALAKALGVSSPTVARMGREHNVKLPAAAMGRQLRPPRLESVELPRWVPPHYEAEFWRVVALEGEYAAAARVRRLKAGERANA